MNRNYLLLLTTCSIFTAKFSFGQKVILGKTVTINGIAEYIHISNKSNYTKTISDESGNFSIRASINDSISIRSTLYEEISFKINEKHLNEEILIILLTEKTNQLDEVFLERKFKPQEFDLASINKDFKSIVSRDLKNNPNAYTRKEDLINPDFNILGVAGLIYNTLKPKT